MQHIIFIFLPAGVWDTKLLSCKPSTLQYCVKAAWADSFLKEVALNSVINGVFLVKEEERGIRSAMTQGSLVSSGSGRKKWTQINIMKGTHQNNGLEFHSEIWNGMLNIIGKHCGMNTFGFSKSLLELVAHGQIVCNELKQRIIPPIQEGLITASNKLQKWPWNEEGVCEKWK